MKEHKQNFLELVQEALTKIKEVDVFEVKSKLEKQEDFLLVDVR